jgi:hypothetical protein
MGRASFLVAVARIQLGLAHGLRSGNLEVPSVKVPTEPGQHQSTLGLRREQ